MFFLKKSLLLLSILSLLFIFSVSGCKINQKNQENEVVKSYKSQEEGNSSIVFVMVDVYRLSGSKPDSLVLNEIQIVDGFLKQDLDAVPFTPAGKWKCSFLDNQNNVLKSAIVDDPLILETEQVIENSEKGEMSKEISMLDKSDIIVRAQYEESMRYVLFEKMDSNGIPTVHTKFNIH